jgi:hypothetical protein
MSRPRDLSFEALASVTSTDWDKGRGELNHALKSIREQSSQLDDTELATEIVYRAKLYKQSMGDGIYLTPSALAKHWLRVVEQAPRRQVVNAERASTGCQTCDGHGMVLVSTRPSLNPDSPFEEWGLCPDCRGVRKEAFLEPF